MSITLFQMLENSYNGVQSKPPTETENPTQASWELCDDLMITIGKSVITRRAMNSVISQIQERENDWYSKIYDDMNGDGEDSCQCVEDIFRFHTERRSEGYWVYEKYPPEGIAFFGVNAIQSPDGLQ